MFEVAHVRKEFETVEKAYNFEGLRIAVEKLQVTSLEEAERAVDILRKIKEVENVIEGFWMPKVRLAKSLYDAVNNAYRKAMALFSSRAPYKENPENLRQKVESKLLAFHRQLSIRLRKLHEQTLEEVRRQIEEIEQQIAETKDKEARKLLEERRKWLEASLVEPDVVTKKAIPGIQVRESTSVEVEDKRKLLEAVLSGSIPDYVVDIRKADVMHLIKQGIQVPGIRVEKREYLVLTGENG